MGQTTKIEWCDSTFNPQMGCNGCELWNDKVRTCYAGILTERMGAVNAHFPHEFEQPQLFLDRLLQITRWGDLTGKNRADKPWLDGLPRFVFLNDMGDTFTEGLDLDWLARSDLYDDDLGRKLHWMSPLQIMADTPHFYLLLTKRPARAARFTEQHGPFPDNFMVMTSVTSAANERRIEWLLKVDCKWKGLSVEPMLGPVVLKFDDCLIAGDCYELRERINWVIIGNESGRDRRDWKIEWPIVLTQQCLSADVPVFVKQVIDDRGKKVPFDEFPAELQYRQVPKIAEVPA